MSNTVIRFDDLSPKQRILFELLLREKKNKRNQEVIPRSTTIDVTPLSFAQQRLWFLNQLAPDSPSYNIPLAVQLNGKLNRVALCWNLNEIVQRHDVLRTTFVAVDGRPMQRVAAGLILPLPVVDLHALPIYMRKTVTHRLIIEEAQQCFDLAHGPLLRTILLRLDEEAHVLLLTLHHIVADGWSLEILCSELSALYNAWGMGKPAHLPELPIQYADYAIWQRAWLQGSVLDAQLSYWRQQLADLPVLHLPTDRPHPPAPSFRGTLQRLVLPTELSAGLLTLSRQVETTLFMTLLTAFQLLLARYTAQIDIVVGSPIANRTHDEIENLIGCFANTLVLRTNLSGNPTITEVLQRVRKVTLAAFEHQDLPFDLLVESLQPERDLNRAPLFQVMFDFQSNARLTRELVGISLHALDLGSETAKFDLTLRICETEHELIGVAEYCTDLFDAATITRMLGHFEVVLLGMAANPDLRFADIQILTAAERQQLLVDWNATQTAYPRDACLHELFTAQAEHTPDAVAVVFDQRPTTNDQRPTTEDRGWKIEDRRSKIVGFPSLILDPQSSILNPQSLTYRELDRRAEQLAQQLRALGVGPEVTVAICMERSVELVVGLLSVLKAGGVYLPLDPAYPEERLAFMLEDAQAPVLLTRRRDWELGKRSHSHSPIPNPQSPIPVYLDADWPAIVALPAMPSSALSAANLAYVIYTSGSIGRPKGAMNTHRAIVNRLCWMQDAYRLTSDDVVLQKTPFSFDVAVWEFFWPLLNGARLILARPGGHQDSAYLACLIAFERVTTLHFVPPMLQVFLEEPDLARCDTLRRVICSGEALPVELQDRCCARLRVELHNLYGPTEAAVDVTAWVCAPVPGQRSVPIGYPIANTQIYLLDRQMQPVPVGVPGELYIGGAQLARGYLRRPDLTAERFIPNPFAEVLGAGCWVLEDSALNTQHPTPNTRLYCTGDLARYQPDGAIEFLGRIDQQVKLRGFRIELGEIEAALNQHPLVQGSVVVVREDVPGSKRLVAYVVSKIEDRGLKIEDSGSSAPDPLSSILYPLSSELRRFLHTRLPDYMLPAAFVLLETLPLMPNGKVDRRALPVPDKSRLELEQPFVAPRSPVEDLLATIWTQVLGVTQVSIHDNFFALGGHSLLATQVIARVRHAFQMELPLRQLFEAPTIVQLAERLETAQRGSQEPLAPPIRPVSRDRALPLSFAQQRLWFLDQLEPHRPTYTIPAAVRLTGPLGSSALQQSLSMIVRRHEILRTTFRLVAGQPVQVIALAAPVLLPLIDLQGIPVEERESLAARLASVEARRSFDLTHGPLVYATLLRLAAVEHVLLLTMHHIVSDGWSTDVLVRELRALYAAYTTGQPPALAELPIQYADYAVWQQAWLQEAVLEVQLPYWRRQLADLPTLDLPTDHPRPPIQTFHGAIQSFALPTTLNAWLLALSRQEGVTLFMTLLAAFQTLLARYSGQHDIVVGTPIANRTRDEIEGLIGFFVNTLVMRTDLSGNPSFRALLARVREVCLGAYAHQDLPFEQLVAILQPPRDLSRSPLFQVMFVLQNTPRPTQGPPGLSLSSLPVDSRIVKFDMTLALIEAEQGLLGSLEYNTDLFDTTTITRMLGHFQMLFDGIVAAPDQPITRLPLLTDAERQQLLVEWTATQAPYPTERCFHELVEGQVARAPDTIAVVFDGPLRRQGDKETRRQGDREPHRDETLSPQSSVLSPQSLTYRELNARANQLARVLRAARVGTGVLVGVCVERSAELVIALLGILKAGGAYLPLDPTYPPARLAFMLADAQAPLLLTQQRLLEGLPEYSARVICLDADWPTIAAQRADNLSGLVTADDLAYVIYTSGSTGWPKGALLHHRGLCNLAAAQQQTFGLRVDSHVLQFASLSFDASTFEIAMALPVGAALCLATPDQLLPGPGLVQLLREQAISIVTLPPSALAVLPTADLPALRTISVAGEACGGELVARWAGGRHFFNLYGPTEATVWVTAAECSADGQPPTIGRPIANTQVYLLDPGLQPVPIGVPGELHIGGAGLALGYLNRPDLTAERFVPNPFAGDKETRRQGDKETGDATLETQNSKLKTQNLRLYRTGDLARYRADGMIEFLGRIDAQVKVRGFRIELGEIEAVLGQHLAVRESVVVAREDVPGDRRLVAYVVPKIEDRGLKIEDSGSSAPEPLSSILYPLSSELRSFLQTKLPAYMLPSAFVLLETLPLTPTGKVDRRALPAPATSRPELEDAYVAPRSPIEELLSQIWAAVLQLDRVGVHDDFFALGGHSLLATQAVARAREIFQAEVPLRSLFEAPTVAGLAERIVAARQNAPSLIAPPLHPVPRNRSLPLSYAQQRLWFLDQLEPHRPVYNIPAALHLTGPLAIAALARSLSAIVARHEALRTTFAAEDGHAVQVIAPLQRVPLPLLDLQHLPADVRTAEVSRLTQAEAQRPFGLKHGPLLRTTLLRLAVEDHVLLLTMHHIVADGWSVGVLCRELATLYAARITQRPALLPELPIQYADYAVWQHQWLRGEVLENHLAYWHQQLADLPTLDLPTDRPRPAAMTFQGAHQGIAISRTMSAGLIALSRQEGATLFMTLAAAWQALLARYSGQDAIAIGVPIANRTRPEIEDLIGCFVNTLVLRANLVGNPSFRVLLGWVREVCLDAYAHQEVPFEQVVEALGPARDLSHHPLFQVMLVLQNAPEAALELPGLTLSSLPAAGTTTKFDLTLSLAEGADGLAGVLEYSTDLFDVVTITRMGAHFQTLLAGIVADPARPLADLPLLTDAERQQLLLDWNATQTAYPHDQRIHELFAAQVTQMPDTMAVVFDGRTTIAERRRHGEKETRREGDTETQPSAETQLLTSDTYHPTPITRHPLPDTQHLTYRELNERADRMAHYLQALGVGPEVCVGIYLERSLTLVAGLLGVLKAGGAYVPLDPAYPPERLAFMLDDAQALVLLSQSWLVPPRPTDQMQVICLDTDWPAITAAPAINPPHTIKANNLAYVIYTSGSTGRPKGVQVTHESVCNLAIAQRRIFAIQPDSRILQVAALSFDVMVSDIFTALLAGATLCLVSSEALLPGPALIRLLDEQQITFMELSASVLAALPVADLPALQTLISGGEPCPAELVARWSGGRQFFNVYGPTEATVATTVATFTAAGRTDNRPLPIGRPIDNTQVYLLDTKLQPVPIGVPGELHIGGVGLARGYRNHPDLTAERFIPNPFGGLLGDGCWVLEDSAPVTQHPSPNTRLYRTGDRARYRADGNIEFLGRLDQQVKLRGYRIELGEVEAALAQHPGVREVVVVAREDVPGAKELVAYVVPRREQGTADRGQEGNVGDTASLSPITYHLSPGELRAFLRTKLPDYMLPSAFVLLEALPLTPNGKVDRRALPAPDRCRPDLDETLVTPRTPVEELLSQIWTAVLRLERIGVHNNFFALGGHSLLATQVVARVRDAFQVEVPLRSLFEAPTIAGLAAHVEAMWRGVSGLRIPPPQPVPRTGPPPLSFAQQRLWFLDQLIPNSPVYNLPAAMRLTGKLDVAAMRRSLGVIVRRHEVLRTTFAMLEGQPVQVIASAQTVPLPLIDLQTLPQNEREAAARRLTAAHALRPFDLAHGPLLRATVLRLDMQEHVVLLNMHHIVADGWSMGIFIQELAALYTTSATGQLASLPELPIQYADFAIWQRNWLQGDKETRRQGDKETRRQGDKEIDVDERSTQNSKLKTQNSPLEEQLAYWRHQLADLPALQLPTDHPRPLVPSLQGASRSFVLPRALYDQLLALSRAEGVTLFMTALAGWQVLLARYSQQHDIAVGTDVANRTRAEIEGLIGFFVNQLVLRTDISGNPPFKTLLQQVREVALGAYAHQDLPFEQVVKELNPERNLAYEPLFQVKLILQNAPLTAPAMADLTLRPFGDSEPMARFDLVLSLTESMDGLAGMLVYRTDLLDAVTIAHMAGHFQTLLEGIVTQPTRRLADLPILTAAERQQLLVDWNATEADYPQDACLHHLFAAQAARSPDTVAVVFDGPGVRGQRSGVRGQRDKETRRQGDKETRFSAGSQHPTPNTQHPTPNTQHLTYHELNARANQLAHYLRSLGVGPEVRVGLCVERSLDLLVGLLGVLKAGGAYVPLDPTYPQDRLAFMIADSQVPMLLTQARLIDTLPSNWAHLIYLDGDWTTITRECVENPAGAVQVDNLAYVIYTSGSTGTPKGTLVAHRGLCNVAEAQRATFATHPDNHVLQFATLSFDAAIFELMLALPAGATLCMAPADALLPGPQLIRLLRDLAVTHLTLPPSALAALPHAPLPDLRTINVAGEACPASLAARWGAGRRFWNLYGPTEATIWTTAMDCGAQAAPPIGRPIANTHIYLLDAQLQPLPVGVPGEIHIGGVGLARGYLNQPDLTAERFIPNPFGEVLGVGCWVTGAESSNTQHPTPNTRLYKTGDRARYLPDGNLEFLGRIDQQVKLRGFRIELGEVEAALASHPNVQEAVVVVREDAPGDRRLVAYVVPTPEPRTKNQEPVAGRESGSWFSVLGSGELRAFLKERLPGYMVPSAFVVLDALPLTPSGKVDRKGLPALDRARPALDNAFAVPRTSIEARLARIWADVLGVEQVGIHDNFFASGGDSILGIQMIARAHQAGLQLTPGQLFQHQTLSELAAVAQATTVAPIGQGLVEGPVPLTPIQHWFFEQNLPAPQHYNQALLLEIRRSLVPLLLERAAQHLLAHHDALHLRFVRNASGWQQRHTDAAAPLPCTWVDLSGLPLSEQGGAIETVAAAAQSSLDLAAGPLMRMIFFDCGVAQPGRLLLIVHHLIVDGVSWRVLLEDLQTAYGQLSRGEAVVLPPKPTSFQQWAERLVAYAQSDALQEEMAYWLRVARGGNARLLVDHAAVANTVASARHLTVALSVDETRVLLQEVPPVYQTQINDVLLTALAQTLAQWTGHRTLLIDLEGHGREDLFADVDLSRTVGWCTTLFPVLLDLELVHGPGPALKAIKEQLRQVPHHGIGYGMLRYLSEDAVAAQLRALPQAEISFNYLGQVDQLVAEAVMFRLAQESSGPAQSADGMRSYLLEINGVIAGGQLRMEWSYSEQLHDRPTIERLAQNYLAALRTLITHCQSSRDIGYTPSDFPDVGFDQNKLDDLIAKIYETLEDEE